MTQAVKIVRVFKSDKSKDGKEFKDRNGKKFWKVAIQTDRHGDDWYSCLAFKEDDAVMKLEEGQEVSILTEENNGYKNFKIPSRFDLLEERVALLEKQIVPQGVPVKVPEIRVDDSDIPF